MHSFMEKGFIVNCIQTHFSPAFNFVEIGAFQSCTSSQRFDLILVPKCDTFSFLHFVCTMTLTLASWLILPTW